MMKKKWTKPSLKILVHDRDQENLVLGDCEASNLSAGSAFSGCEYPGDCGNACSSAA